MIQPRSLAAQQAQTEDMQDNKEGEEEMGDTNANNRLEKCSILDELSGKRIVQRAQAPLLFRCSDITRYLTRQRRRRFVSQTSFDRWIIDAPCRGGIRQEWR